MEQSPYWMPLYIGDYLSDTIGLTHAEHGSYLLSIFKYWMKGESLTDHELREVCGRYFGRVEKFYVMEGNRWHHKRIDEELTKARDRMRAAREKSMKGVQARLNKGKT